MSGVPTFIDLSIEEQCQELRSFFKKLEADISEENSPEGYLADIRDIIAVCESCFKVGNENDVEGVLNSIVSLLLLCATVKEAHDLIVTFCEKVIKAPPNQLGHICLKVLQNLFEGLGEHSPFAYDIYYHMVKLAGQIDAISSIYTEFSKLKAWYQDKDISVEKLQKLLRLLYEVLVESKMSDQASKVMVELLSTYTEDNASQARDDAHRCIVTCLADPNTFLLDHLLFLKPVRFLEGELIHELLSIFVTERLEAYQNFYRNNKDFVQSLGLSHEQCLHKMRLLTFMQMAETQKEIPFEALQTELDLGPKDIECFIIDALRTKMVQAKIDQMQGLVVVNSTMHRTFGKPQWLQLRDYFTTWYQNLSTVENSMQQVLTNTSFQNLKLQA